jgi:hypothetical protein
MKVIFKRTFLLKQQEGKKGKMEDVVAEAGKETEVSDKEAKQFAAYIDQEATKELNDSKKASEKK